LIGGRLRYEDETPLIEECEESKRKSTQVTLVRLCGKYGDTLLEGRDAPGSTKRGTIVVR